MPRNHKSIVLSAGFKLAKWVVLSGPFDKQLPVLSGKCSFLLMSNKDRNVISCELPEVVRI